MANQPDRETGDITVFNDADLAGIAVGYIVVKMRSETPTGTARVAEILGVLEDEFSGNMVAHELFLTYSESARTISVGGAIAVTAFTVGGFKTEVIAQLKAFQALPAPEQDEFIANFKNFPVR